MLERARRGDAKAFSEIIRRYEDTVYNFSFSVCRDREYAEETLQDTFINVYRKIGQFDGRSKFSTWLYTIVANNCLMKRRRRKLEAASVSLEDLKGGREDGSPREHEIQSSRHTPLDEAMSRELRRRLDEAVQKLPVDYRLVFILRDLEGRSAEETADIMNLKIPAVKSRLHRARRFLREELREYV